MRGGLPGIAASLAVLTLASCVTTVDSIGYNDVTGIHLQPVNGLPTYPNPFKDLDKSDADVANKIAATFNQLFYGDPNLQAIYVPTGADQATILDTLHMDERTEGIGLAMMIAVQLDKRSEFDRLWNYAVAMKKQKTGARRGYFESRCDTLATTTIACDDPFGEAQMLTALIFAHGRWTSTSGPVDYEAGALDLLYVMRHKQDENGGIVDDITNTFDTTTALPFHLPVVAAAGISRPSIVMPAYYDIWAQATGDPFWTRAAAAGRSYWKATAAHSADGLLPVRASFEGVPVLDWDTFDSESYRAQVNMAVDWAWARGARDPWQEEEANRLLKFFSRKGINVYGSSYTLDGAPIDTTRDFALVAVNGVTGMVSTNIDRAAYVNAVFDMATPSGPARYYSGILQLTGLLILSGQYRIW